MTMTYTQKDKVWLQFVTAKKKGFGLKGHWNTIKQ